MRRIDLEAHFFTEEYVEHMLSRKKFPRMESYEDEDHQKFMRWLFQPSLWAQNTLSIHNKLLNLGEERLKEMDDAGIDVQVLSLPAVGCEQFDGQEGTVMARKINDELSRLTKEYPDRFIGLATLAPQDPEAAADELERTVTELGFKGAKMNSNIGGEYLDERKYWVILERAEKLGIPIAIHPGIPSSKMLAPYADYGYLLAGPTTGFIAETSLHAMRLIVSGVLDRFPGLKIILGHMGEGLPFWLSRIDIFGRNPGQQSESHPKLGRKPSDYLKDNFIVTISGMFFQPAFICTYLALGAEKIAFAVDAPFEAYEDGVRFMESLPICEIDKEKIYHLNAERLFKIG